MRLRTLVCFIGFMPVAFTLRPVSAQTSVGQQGSHQAILTVLNKSAEDWNRGDLEAFATSYKNSPDILFMGRTIKHGYAQMLTNYKAGYSTREQMGTLSFSRLETQPLDERFATVTGHFHLERTTPGGGNADGYFLLVMERTPEGWKIVRDDTSALPASSAK